ncbi:methylenetetrahydrofolate reductase [NAD(P)H] [Thioflexithrix psekupsensis]|nr:methylenetetrahydrofolate reductase [NAD(P)H] [Thioflexithrix psekupsensis]
MNMKTSALSCEFFPPRTAEGDSQLKQVQEQLKVLNPSYYSVTFGAGGSTQEKTYETVVDIQNRCGVHAAPHLSCIGSSKTAISALLKAYQTQNISRIVALRGDRPSGMMGRIGDFNYANELVQFIRECTGDYFHIEVAAYPECHPESRTASADLDAFVDKVAAGANAAITQYFYNDEAYYRFIEACQQRGVTIPIVPGIMPINNFTQLVRFSDMCGAEIPRWLRWRLGELEHDRASLRAYGLDVVTDLCRRLLQNGAPGLHFYTLNQAELTLEIARRLGMVTE